MFVREITAHNHDPVAHALALAQHIDRIRNIVKVGVTSMRPCHVTMSANSALSKAQAVHAPKESTVSRMVGRLRAKVKGVAAQKAAKTLEELEHDIDPRYGFMCYFLVHFLHRHSSIDWSEMHNGTDIEDTLWVDVGHGKKGPNSRIMGQMTKAGIEMVGIQTLII